MTCKLCCLLAGILGAGTTPASAQEGDAGGPFDHAIAIASQRVVKLYGAGIGREHGYGSGVIVSADGKIVTTLSVLLEGRELRVVLPDGRKLPGKVVARDERRQLALLQVEADGLPFFELAGSDHLRIGDWLLAAANPFQVAEGAEPVSIAAGVLSARMNLDGRRRAQDYAYTGPALLTDMIISTPGCAGGALVDVEGRLVGVIGKAVVSNRSNTWVNHALPVEEVAAFINAPHAKPTTPTESSRPLAATQPNVAEAAGQTARKVDLGIRLFDVGGRTRPAYVERVRRDSPAKRAGIRPNDLIVTLAGTAIGTCDDYRAAVKRLRPGDQIEVVVKRGQKILTLKLTVEQ